MSETKRTMNISDYEHKKLCCYSRFVGSAEAISEFLFRDLDNPAGLKWDAERLRGDLEELRKSLDALRKDVGRV